MNRFKVNSRLEDWLMIVAMVFYFLLLVSKAFAETRDMCQGNRFEPCVCWYDVPKFVSYRPSERLCKGAAAVIMRKSYFSVVLRDAENRDRIPVSLSFCSDNSCSVFKTQKVITRTRSGVREKINCLGASGSSKIMKTAVRITVKFSDRIDPRTGEKPIGRYCLKSPKTNLN